MRAWTGTLAPILNENGRVHPLDLVMQLGRNRRFGGAGDTEWSGLHHSVFVALIWLQLGYPREQLDAALLHDGHEAYTGDLIGPLKRLIRDRSSADPVKSIEADLDAEIRKALGTRAPDPETAARVKFCDRIALIVEAQLFGAPGQRCEGDVPDEYRETVARAVRELFPDLSEITERRGRGIPPTFHPGGSHA